jgi:hypothetical protein
VWAGTFTEFSEKAPLRVWNMVRSGIPLGGYQSATDCPVFSDVCNVS